MLMRQGDVLLRRVDSIPRGLKRVPAENGRVVLAHGEATGHHHSFEDDGGVSLLEGDSGERFLDVGHGADLEHQEHGAIAVPPGSYEVVRQREYSPEAIRNVAD